MELPAPLIAALAIGFAGFLGAKALVHGTKVVSHKVVAGVHKVVHPHKK